MALAHRFELGSTKKKAGEEEGGGGEKLRLAVQKNSQHPFLLAGWTGATASTVVRPRINGPSTNRGKHLPSPLSPRDSAKPAPARNLVPDHDFQQMLSLVEDLQPVHTDFHEL